MELIPFLLITVVTVLAFANIYHFVGPTSDDDSICNGTLDQTQFDDGGWTCSRYDSIVSSLTMALGGGWLFLGDYPHSKQSVVSMLYAFIIGIFLLNFIIAIMNGAFNRIKEKSKKVFWSNRHQFLVGDVESIERLIKCCCRKWIDDNRCPTFLSQIYSSDIDDDRYFFLHMLLRPIGVIRAQSVVRRQYTNVGLKMPFDLGMKHLIHLIAVFFIFIPLNFIVGVFTFGIVWAPGMKEALFFGPVEENCKEEGSYLLIDEVFEEVIDVKSMGSKVDNLIKQNNNLTVQNSELNLRVSDLNTKVDKLIAHNSNLTELNKILIAKMDELLEGV